MPHTQQDHLTQFFSGTTEKKLQTMEDLASRHGRQLLDDEAIQASLTLLKIHAAALANHMTAMDLGSQCSACAAVTGGCCSSYMEANSDVILLLINVLYGATVSLQHGPEDTCGFLAEDGCILPVKPMFCLNYNCSHIHTRATQEAMKKLEKLAGTILTEQTSLEEMILRAIERS